jgi:hypothetical protein
MEYFEHDMEYILHTKIIPRLQRRTGFFCILTGSIMVASGIKELIIRG